MRRRWQLAATSLTLLSGCGGLTATGQGTSAPPAAARLPAPAAPAYEVAVPWPMYGYDARRSHLAPASTVRPPFAKRWRISTSLVEFPPVTGYGLVYFAQIRGQFQALDRMTGEVVWSRNFKHCSASSPAIADGVVYHAFMGATCPRSPSARGMIVAMDALTGKVRWRVATPVVESSLLVVNGTLYYGGWDSRVYALNLRTHRIRWSYRVDSSITDSAAYGNGTVFIGTDHGHFYALDAATGRLRWQQTSFARFGSREYFYATPTVAYGNVYAPNTDGYVYAFAAKTGKLRWARRIGSYVYSAAAVQNRTLYVGTYSGQLVAMSATNGRVKWAFNAPSAVHGAPTIVNGVVYFSTVAGRHPGAARPIKVGPGVTIGVDLRTHKAVWTSREGRYVPIIADSTALYFVGFMHLTALVPKVAP